MAKVVYKLQKHWAHELALLLVHSQGKANFLQTPGGRDWNIVNCKQNEAKLSTL